MDTNALTDTEKRMIYLGRMFDKWYDGLTPDNKRYFWRLSRRTQLIVIHLACNVPIALQK